MPYASKQCYTDPSYTFDLTAEYAGSASDPDLPNLMVQSKVLLTNTEEEAKGFRLSITNEVTAETTVVLSTDPSHAFFTVREGDSVTIDYGLLFEPDAPVRLEFNLISSYGTSDPRVTFESGRTIYNLQSQNHELEFLDDHYTIDSKKITLMVRDTQDAEGDELFILSVFERRSDSETPMQKRIFFGLEDNDVVALAVNSEFGLKGTINEGTYT